MKIIRKIQITITIVLIPILIGCSDQLMNPESSSKDISGDESVNHITGNSADNRFTTQIRLKPNQYYTFNSSNTGFKWIYSINAEKVTSGEIDILNLSWNGITVYSSTDCVTGI